MIVANPGLSRAKREGWAHWIRSEADERAVRAGMRFDQRLVDRVVAFGERLLRHCEGPSAGQPFTLMDWQYHDLFGPLYGWVKWSEHYQRWVRRYDRTYVEVAKKNGKSPTGAYIGLYELVGDEEPGAKVFSAATDKDQAAIVHTHAINMAESSPRLMDLLRINRTTKAITFPQNRGVYRVISSNPRGQEGLNANCIIADELHVWRGRELWDAIKYAFASRPEPIFFCITTAGEDLESVCYEQRLYAQAVANGDILDLGFLPLIYAAEPTEDMADPAVWRKANPSLGVTIDPERFARDYEEATQRPETFSAFKRYRLNVWGSSEDAWLDRGAWDRCTENYTPEDLEGSECWAGLDLAQTRDFTALALVFPFDGDDGETFYRQLWWFWLPRETARLREKILPYRTWEEGGFIELTDGATTDYRYVKKRILEIAERYDLRELTYDRRFADQFTLDLEENHEIIRVEFPQTMDNFAEPTAEYERLVIRGQMRNDGNKVARWQAGHCKVKSDANGNKRPVKPKHGDHRTIDGLVASVMAFARAWKSQPQVSHYDDNDLELG